jgi:hypothetical protein
LSEKSSLELSWQQLAKIRVASPVVVDGLEEMTDVLTCAFEIFVFAEIDLPGLEGPNEPLASGAVGRRGGSDPAEFRSSVRPQCPETP